MRILVLWRLMGSGKHINGLGIEHFMNPFSPILSVLLIPCHPWTILRSNAAVWFCATTDRGSNETQARKHILAMTADIPQVIFLESDCLEHSLHLAVLGGLLFIDGLLQQLGRPWRYYSSLAVFANCCRDSAREIFTAWESMYGCHSAMEHAQALMPKCVSSRWGSVDSVEERVLQTGMSTWAPCVSKVFLEKILDTPVDDGFFDQVAKMLPNDLRAAFSSKAGRAKSKKEAKKRTDSAGFGSTTTPVGGVDLLALEELAEYSARVNRWQRHVLLTVNDRLFGCLIAVMHRSRSPIMHLSNFLKKTSTSKQTNREAGGSLFQLVSFKAAEVQSEFDSMLRNLPTPSYVFCWLILIWYDDELDSDELRIKRVTVES